MVSALLAVSCAAVAFGQSARVYRTEFIPFDTREGALSGDSSAFSHYLPYRPQPAGMMGRTETVSEHVEIPTSWSDYDVYLHVENTIKAYDVAVNGRIVASVEDAYTPADFLLSPYLRQGGNDIALLLRRSTVPELSDGATGNLCAQFEGCCIFAQYRIHVFDYDARILPDSTGRNAILTLDIISSNSFPSPQGLDICYDIYSPEGKLLDYGMHEVTVPGRSRDTLRMTRNLGEASRFLWGGGKAPLYSMMLFVRRAGKPREYIPFRIGMGESTHADGSILRNGHKIAQKAVRYNARSTRSEAERDLRELKRSGRSLVIPDNPQPRWFYDICDKLGIGVIERANINPSVADGVRSASGNPSNNPALADEYLDRTKGMYYRTRNHPCIVGYALSGDNAGNGYNLYRTYEWFRSTGDARAAICPDAGGEWNTDVESVAADEH